MKDKWILGPKFREYFCLNFRMVWLQLLGTAVLSLAGPGRILAWVVLSYALMKLYSATLYHQQACLYQSVPVSSFETVLAKTLIGSMGAVFPLVFMTWPWSVVHILQSFISAFLLCGIVLFGVAVGNRMRGSRDKRPNAATAAMVIVGLLLLILGIQWLLEQLKFLNPAAVQWTGLVLSTIGAGFLFWINVRALDVWYSI